MVRVLEIKEGEKFNYVKMSLLSIKKKKNEVWCLTIGFSNVGMCVQGYVEE